MISAWLVFCDFYSGLQNMSVCADAMDHKAPLSVAFSRQEYWSGLSFPSSGDLPDPGIEPRSPTLQADSLPSEPPGKPLCYEEVVHKGFKKKVVGREMKKLSGTRDRNSLMF